MALAQPAEGECASGFCGTPNNNGGGCGCGCGSILVNNTDLGDSYSTSDDYDSDGFEDDFDNCPYLANREQADSDSDGWGDACDNAPGVANADQRDTDGDGVGDVEDPDMDNDTLANASDNCPLVPNLAQTDTDGDGKGDACDDDDDGDGVLDWQDNCPLVANPEQSNTTPDQYGDACDNDADQDGIDDSRDNCQMAYNVDQADLDGDGWGDACDLDIDDDLIENRVDNCPMKANPDQADDDHDGAGNECDPDGFCFVASKNVGAPCLDPRSVFAVTAAPRVTAETGEEINLSIYANRENVQIRYAWAVTARPSGSSATVTNPKGTVMQSEAYEYHYADDGKRPVFVPDHAGEYELTVAADLVADDELFPGSVHAESSVVLVVTGEPLDSGGCRVAPAGRRSLGLALAPLAALLLAGVRRRRRR